jgi:hypothetical protein
MWRIFCYGKGRVTVLYCTNGKPEKGTDLRMVISTKSLIVKMYGYIKLQSLAYYFVSFCHLRIATPET